MAREVTHERQGPDLLGAEDIEAHGGDVAICRCGLSGDRPFCDGSHEATGDEDPETRYKYEDDDPEGPRREIETVVYAEED